MNALELRARSSKVRESLVGLARWLGVSTRAGVCFVALVRDSGTELDLAACWPEDQNLHRQLTTGLSSTKPVGVEAKIDLRTGTHPYMAPALVSSLGFVEARTYPIWDGTAPLGYVCCAWSESNLPREDEWNACALAAQQCALALGEAKREAVVDRYTQLGHWLGQIDSASSPVSNSDLPPTPSDEPFVKATKGVQRVILKASLALTGAERGWVSLLDANAGKLDLSVSEGDPADRSLKYGQGITGKAMDDLEPVCVDDVRDGAWQGIYEEFWGDTVSELAVPLVIRDARVRRGRDIQRAPKRLGVINLESPRSRAFTEADVNLLRTLAAHAAVVLDRMRLVHKLDVLAHAQQLIVGNENWDQIVARVASAIAEALRYEYVNVSVVNRASRTIETAHVIGLPDGTIDDFKRLARHALDGDDIQCHIVRDRRSEVPDLDDTRYDTNIYRRFGHDRLIRVFVPMIAHTSDEVIGTVDAGYRRSKWQFIFEEDLQILIQFVEYAAEALRRRRAGLLDEIIHELRAPVVGIRNNLSYVRSRLNPEKNQILERKYEDMLSDCRTVLYQIQELDYFLGRPRPKPYAKATLVFRDVVIAAIKELAPELRREGLDPSHVEWSSASITRLGTFRVDRELLKQVVTNLLTNAVKYRTLSPEDFKVWVRVEENTNSFDICFQDSGIGILEKHRSKIFDAGFRTPEAIARSVNGSGLGLNISKRIMREMEGDLVLSRPINPTEFRIVLPRSRREPPK